MNLWTQLLHTSVTAPEPKRYKTESVQNWYEACEHMHVRVCVCVCVCVRLTEFSAKADITLPRDDRDLLIFLASSSTEPSAPVLLTCERTQE